MDCNEIDKRLEALRQTADLLRRQIVDDEAILEIYRQSKKPAGKRQAIKLKSYTGEDITLDPSEFIDHANDIAIRAGSEEIRQMVREGFLWVEWYLLWALPNRALGGYFFSVCVFDAADLPAMAWAHNVSQYLRW